MESVQNDDKNTIQILDNQQQQEDYSNNSGLFYFFKILFYLL